MVHTWSHFVICDLLLAIMNSPIFGISRWSSYIMCLELSSFLAGIS